MPAIYQHGVILAAANDVPNLWSIKPEKATIPRRCRYIPQKGMWVSGKQWNVPIKLDAKTRTRLLGLKYTDKDSGKTYMQTHTGWFKPAGKGWVVYLQPGHSLHDLQNPTYERILLNAVVWKP